jgi:hypothetical protein
MNRRVAIFTLLSLVISKNLLYADERMPIFAKPGQCFTKSFYPPKYKKIIKTTSTKRVKVSESTVRYKVIPPVYSWEEKRFKVSDGMEKIVKTPAIFKRVYERILVEPEKKVWRKSLNPNSKKAFSSCVEAASKSGMDISNAKSGICFYEHFQPARYKSITEKILVAEASQRVETIPATYRTITKKITTSSSTMKLIPVPIKYKKVQDRVVVAPARTEWRKTTCQNRGCNQSEVVCLTKVPTTYKTVTKKVILKPAIAKKVAVKPAFKYLKIQELVTPARAKIVPIPAKYSTVNKIRKVSDAKYSWGDESTKDAGSRIRSECDKICLVTTPAKYKRVEKRILVRPASGKRVVGPAKYTKVKIKRIEKEASFKTITVPAEYTEVIVERERTKGYSKWMPIVCESNMTPTLIRKIQQALKYRGFYHGEVNGIWSLDGKNAIRAYQEANGLSVTRLSIETMKSLGIY